MSLFADPSSAEQKSHLPRFFALRPMVTAICAATLGLTLVGTVSLPAVATAAETIQATTTYRIPAGELGSVLARFAAEANITLSFNANQTRGLNSPGLTGEYSLDAALAQLLANSGLQAVDRGDGNYILRQTTGVALPAMKVSAQSQGNITEGSGSYTSGSVSAATNLALSPRETPQSVSVVTRQRIDDQGLITVADVLGNAPGIATLQLDSERTTFTSRGFSISDFQYDGISSYYKSNYAAGESELDSIIYDRVEIVRGATGLLTGAGEPSASVNLIRKRANSTEFRGETQLSAGSWDNYRGTMDLSGSLSENGAVRGRLAGAYQDRKAFFDRYARENLALYGVVDVDLTDATTLSVGSSYQKSETDGLTYGGVPLWYTDGSKTDFNRSFTVAPKWNQEDIDVTNTFVNLEHSLGNNWNAQLRLMRSSNKVDNARLFVWGFPDAETGLVNDEPSRVRFPGSREQDSADLRISGPFQWFGREHQAVFGASYFDQEAAFDWIGASTPWTAPLDVHDFGQVQEPEWDYENAELSERNHTRQTAAYSALRLSVSDPLTLILGGRLTQYDREGAGWASSGEYNYSDNKFIPYAGLVYDLNQNYSVYTSYTSIFNFQDFRDRNGAWLAPVTGSAYETGLKGEFFDGRLNTSLAAFRIQQDKLGQEDSGHLVPGTDSPAYYATDGATSKGLELEVSGELASGWNGFFFVTRYSAKDAGDNEVNTFLPRTMVRLFTTYQLSGQWQKLRVGGGANWQSRIYYNNLGPNGEQQEQSGYLLASMMARYDFSPQISAQLNINNLFDKHYQTAVNWYGQGIWGAPRNIVANVTYKF